MSLANIKKAASRDSVRSIMRWKLTNALSLSSNALLDPYFGCRAICQLPNNEDNFVRLFPPVVGSRCDRSLQLRHPIRCIVKQSSDRHCFQFDIADSTPLVLSLQKNWIRRMECSPKTLISQDPPICAKEESNDIIVDLSFNPSSNSIPKSLSSTNTSNVENNSCLEGDANQNFKHELPFSSTPSPPLQPIKKFKPLLAGNTDNLKGRCLYHTARTLHQKWPNVGTSSGSNSHMENQASDSTAGGQWNESNMENDTVLTLKEKAGILGKYVQHVRHWDYTHLGAQHLETPLPGFEFTLMSYNILSQDLLRANDMLYHHCDPAILQWNYRSQNLLRELTEFNADVVCLQEVNEDHYNNHFLPNMTELGYAALYKKRTGTKQDGCAIFFKKNVFDLVAHTKIEFFKPGWDKLDRDNIALLAILQPKSSSSHDTQLCVSTTHLLFNPRRGDIKLAQLQLLLAEIDKFAFKGISKRTGLPHYHPVILCGDMNSEPFSPLYNFVREGYLNYSGLRSGDISGQKEGASRGKICHEPLLHPGMGITSTCQYASLEHKKSKNNECTHPVEIMATPNDSYQGTSFYSGYQRSQSSSISHHLNFLSAYNHEDHDGSHFVTTQHTRASCTVDYIFYSARHNNGSSSSSERGTSTGTEGRLRLLGTFRTMTESEVKNVGGLPNAYQSSDHLALLAKFLMKLS